MSRWLALLFLALAGCVSAPKLGPAPSPPKRVWVSYTNAPLPMMDHYYSALLRSTNLRTWTLVYSNDYVLSNAVPFTNPPSPSYYRAYNWIR